MTFNLLTIATIVSAVISLIVVIAILVIAKNVIRIKRYVLDWKIIENEGNEPWKCQRCNSYNDATKRICEYCGQLQDKTKICQTF